MGVHGLWKLLEAAGKPVPLESLENKVLAVDVSIWLHQLMKGFQDSRGAAVPNAHLLGLFHRVCKLLYYRIKPVFVFDGGVPLLKRQTIAARKKLKKLASQSAADAKRELLKNLVKRKAVRDILNVSKAVTDNQDESVSKDDMFQLPPLPNEGLHSESEDESRDKLQVFMESGSDSESEPETKPSLPFLAQKLDLHTLDVHSEEFCSLPADVRHDILSELKETRKQNSWGRLHEMPEESGEFSNFQLGRLLKRRNVQCAMEKAEKEMGGKVMRMNELQELMEAQGVDIIEDNTLIDSASQRIASDSTTRFVLCKDSSRGQSSQSSQSSSSTTAEPMEVPENPLYNEQVNFIAQMAENMLQQIEKKKQGKNENISKEKSEEILCKLSDAGISLFTSDNVTVPKEKLLVDSWSSDDETENNISISVKVGEGISKAVEKVSPKWKFGESTSDQSPASQVLKNDSDGTEENHHKESSICSPVSDTVREDKLYVEESTKAEHKDSSSDECEEFLEVKYPKKNADVNINVDLIQNKAELAPQSSIKEVDLMNRKKPLEITIQPGDKPDVDDIFADVFQKSTNLEVTKERERNDQPLEIVINPGGIPDDDDDDIFADVFQSHVLETVKEEISSESEPEVSQVSPLNEIEKKTSNADTKETFNTALTDKDKLDSEKQNTDKETDNSVISSLFLNNPTSSTDWNEMEASLEAEELNLQRERGRQERLAASITDQMCVEAQELLQLFGLPYLVAPMEAEAQCAFLDAISLTEGSITDDSDIWLFGGKKVYKNFFNQKKHVLQFTSSNIDHYFKLSREQLVQLALLVGSDYTTGIQGVGPVTALEIIAAFHNTMESDPVQIALKGLGKFRDWWKSGRPHRSNHMRLLDKKLKNLKFSEGFPSQAVVEAYLRPSVDDSQDTFSWGALDLPALREYARSKFGWTVSKTDEILLPVAKKWTARSSQRSIDSYFNLQPHLVEGLGKMSKRVQKAITLMEVDAERDDADDPDPRPTNPAKVKKQVKKRPLPSSEKISKNVKTKKKKRNSSDSESDSEVCNVKQRNQVASEETTELPVRAPTFPRQRTSTGVKRVGLKSVQGTGEDKTQESSVVVTGSAGSSKPKEQGARKKLTRTCTEQPFSDRESDFPEHEKTQSVQVSRKTRAKKHENQPARASKFQQEKSSAHVTRARVNSRKISSSCDDNSEAAYKSDECADTRIAKVEITGTEHTKCVNDLEKLSSRMPTSYLSQTEEDNTQPTRNVSRSTFDDGQLLEQLPSSSRSSFRVEGAEVSSDLAALSEMNWEDDPWDIGEAQRAEEHRPKIFFGGIRPNKPRKPTTSRPTNPVVNADSRGMRPGWLTQERLESRTAWVDAMHHRKKEESIPQREQDQRALEDAKMKAIEVVKASGAKQASRLLGRQTSKRVRGKARPTRKMLPEHNLSESSSDE